MPNKQLLEKLMFIITKIRSYMKIIIYFQRYGHVKFDDIFLVMKLNAAAERVKEQQNVPSIHNFLNYNSTNFNGIFFVNLYFLYYDTNSGKHLRLKFRQNYSHIMKMYIQCIFFYRYKYIGGSVKLYYVHYKCCYIYTYIHINMN